jgi:O-methyltransferase involved in polyketide biosynthesis
MPDETKVELGQVQQTLFFPLLARARETQSKRPLLSDPKAVEVLGSVNLDEATFQTGLRFIVVIRTMILDWWVRQFLAGHPQACGPPCPPGTATCSRWPTRCSAGASR